MSAKPPLPFALFTDHFPRQQVAEAAAFYRSDDAQLFPKDQFPKVIEDSTSGPGAPDVELVVSPMAWTDHGFGPMASGPLYSIGAILLRPTSRGSVALKSSDAFEPPVVDPQYVLFQLALSTLTFEQVPCNTTRR